MSGTSSDSPGEIPEFAIEVLAGAEDGGSTVVVSGELDVSTVDELDERVRAASGSGAVLLDLAAVSFLDSSGVRVLDSLHRDSDRCGWEFRIAPALDPNVRTVLELTGMLSVLPLASTRTA